MDADPCRLLLVAEDVTLTQRLVAHFQHSDYAFEATNDPMYALDLLSQQPVNLLLLAWPGLNNPSALLDDLLELCQATPLVILAQPQGADEVLEWLRVGVTDVFSLPLDELHQLDRSIARHTRHSLLFFQNLEYRQQLEAAHRRVEQSLAELRQDQQAACLVQQRLMPAAQCELNGLEISRYLRSSLYLSGDFVDYLAIDRQQTLFYVADVSGHGASSAFVTVLLKQTVNRCLREYRQGQHALAPAQLVQQLNQELLDYDLGKHLTVFMGLVDGAAQRLRYCVGGHLPMPILAQQGRVDYLPGFGSGMAVGLFAEAQYQDLELPLADTFSLLLCSDGVLELMDDGCDPEEQLLAKVRAGDADLEAVLQGLGLAEGRALADDVALLQVRRG